MLPKNSSFASVPPRPAPIRTQREESRMSLASSRLVLTLPDLSPAHLWGSDLKLPFSEHQYTPGEFKGAHLEACLAWTLASFFWAPALGGNLSLLPQIWWTLSVNWLVPENHATAVRVSLSVTVWVTYWCITTSDLIVSNHSEGCLSGSSSVLTSLMQMITIHVGAPGMAPPSCLGPPLGE